MSHQYEAVYRNFKAPLELIFFLVLAFFLNKPIPMKFLCNSCEIRVLQGPGKKSVPTSEIKPGDRSLIWL